MRIVLVNVPHPSIGSRIPDDHLPPLGLLSIGGPLIDDGHEVTLPEVEVERRELHLVEVDGHRGDPVRRKRTVEEPVHMEVGPFLVQGYLHRPPQQSFDLGQHRLLLRRQLIQIGQTAGRGHVHPSMGSGGRRHLIRGHGSGQ